ncbi:MAG: hypothetical protein ACRC9X_06330 [Bacteroidales bacterium]
MAQQEIALMRIVLSPKGFGDTRVGAIFRYRDAEMLFEAVISKQHQVYKTRQYSYNAYLHLAGRTVLEQCTAEITAWMQGIDATVIKGELSNGRISQ